MDALAVLLCASSQGGLNWSDNSMLHLACQYIDNQKDLQAFEDFVQKAADEERALNKMEDQMAGKTKLAFTDWKAEVDKLFMEKTCCTWNDLAGDEEPLDSAYKGGETPREFVNYWCDKYDLGVDR